MSMMDSEEPVPAQAQPGRVIGSVTRWKPPWSEHEIESVYTGRTAEETDALLDSLRAERF
jgi:hypothetical protein